MSKWYFQMLILASAILFAAAVGLPGAAVYADPISGVDGWQSAPVHFKVQSPYDIPVSHRYSESHGVYHVWVYNTDKPFSKGNTTRPRTEQRFNPDYTSGEVQYASDIMVPSGTSNVCVFQIHTGDADSSKYGATTFMLFWYSSGGGSLHDYSGKELASGLTGDWFHLNVNHNMITHTITVWINNKQVWQQHDNGAPDFYMKDGVYMQSGGSTEMQDYIKNIHFWTNSGKPVPDAGTARLLACALAGLAMFRQRRVNNTPYQQRRDCGRTQR
jgi:hypothetical protein